MDRAFSCLTTDEKKMIVAALQAVTQTGGSTREWRLANELARAVEGGYNVSDENVRMVMKYQHSVIREWQESGAEFPDLRRSTSFVYPGRFPCATAFSEIIEPEFMTENQKSHFENSMKAGAKYIARVILMEHEEFGGHTIYDMFEICPGYTYNEEELVEDRMEPIDAAWRRTA